MSYVIILKWFGKQCSWISHWGLRDNFLYASISTFIQEYNFIYLLIRLVWNVSSRLSVVIVSLISSDVVYIVGSTDYKIGMCYFSVTQQSRTLSIKFYKSRCKIRMCKGDKISAIIVTILYDMSCQRELCNASTCGVRAAQSLVFCVVPYRSLFVLLSFFFWSLHCLSFFRWLLLITLLIFPNFCFKALWWESGKMVLVKPI